MQKYAKARRFPGKRQAKKVACCQPPACHFEKNYWCATKRSIDTLAAGAAKPPDQYAGRRLPQTVPGQSLIWETIESQ